MKIYLFIFIILNCLFSFCQSGYSYSKTVSISNSIVSGVTNLTDFPVVLQFTDPDLRSVGNGGDVENINGYDIIFTLDACASRLFHQVEYYNPVTGEIICWVRIPTLNASANTLINMYYGNPTILTPTSSTQTWTNNYSSVLHLNNNPATAAPQMTDGSGNGNSGTCIGAMNASNSIVGKISNGVSFDENNDGITIPDFNYNSGFTISFWFNVNEVNGNSFNYLFSHGDWGVFNSTNIYFGEHALAYAPDRGMLKTVFQDANDATSTSGHDVGTGFVDGNWHYYTFTVRLLHGAIVYIDGVKIAEITFQGGDAYNPTTDIYLGCRSDLNATRFYGGELDEFRILNNAMLPDWIATEYNNQNNPTANFTIGPEVLATVNCPILLPVELTSFTGKNIESKNKLQWTTVSERNNDYFTLESSINAINFEPIQTVKGAGNSVEINNYQCVDHFPIASTTYYRLKQTDFDGEETYSQIISIHCPSKGESLINVYPNPNNGHFTLLLDQSEKANIAIKITDNQGKIVFQEDVGKFSGKYSKQIDLKKFGLGIYMIMIEQEGKKNVQKVIVQE